MVFYQSLSEHPEETLRALCDVIGIEFSERMLVRSREREFVLKATGPIAVFEVGRQNRRADSRKTTQIILERDGPWQSFPAWTLPGIGDTIIFWIKI